MHPYTLASRTNQRLKPKLAKEYGCPTLTGKKMKKHGHTTKCINHWADSANLKGSTFNKICSSLIGKCFEMPNASYTEPSDCAKTHHLTVLFL